MIGFQPFLTHLIMSYFCERDEVDGGRGPIFVIYRLDDVVSPSNRSRPGRP